MLTITKNADAAAAEAPSYLGRPAPIGQIVLTAPLQDEQSLDNFLASLLFGIRERHARTLLIDAQTRERKTNLTEMLKVRCPLSWDTATKGRGGLSTALNENSEGIFVLQLDQPEPSESAVRESLKQQFVRLRDSFDLILVAGPRRTQKLNWLLHGLDHDFLAVLNTQNHEKLDTYDLFEQHIDPSSPERLLVVCDRTQSTREARRYFREFETISDIFFENQSEFLGQIALDRAQKKASLFRKPVTQLFPRSESSRSIQTISDRLAMTLIDDYEGSNLHQ